MATTPIPPAYTTRVTQSWIDNVRDDEIRTFTHLKVNAVLDSLAPLEANVSAKRGRSLKADIYAITDAMMETVTSLPDAKRAKAKLDGTSFYKAINEKAPQTPQHMLYRELMQDPKLATHEQYNIDEAIRTGLSEAYLLLKQDAASAIAAQAKKGRGKP